MHHGAHLASSRGADGRSQPRVGSQPIDTFQCFGFGFHQKAVLAVRDDFGGANAISEDNHRQAHCHRFENRSPARFEQVRMFAIEKAIQATQKIALILASHWEQLNRRRGGITPESRLLTCTS